MTDRRLRAYLDESQSSQQRDPHTYLVAATLCQDSVLGAAREQMTSLLLKGQRKLHWHDESSSRRRKIVGAIAELPLEHVVVVRNGLPGERIERRRRLCLQQMFFELDTAAVGMATFESRGPADDKRDRHMLDVMRANRTVSADLRIDHQKGPAEALLWLPDAICGAVTSQRRGDPQYLTTIEQAVSLDLVTLGA